MSAAGPPGGPARGAGRSLLLPGGADLLFLFFALLVVRGARQTLLDDPGLGWHLRTIDAIRAEGWWLTTDPFTRPQPGRPTAWLSNQWLGELPLWLGWKWAGEEGVAAVTALVLAFTLRCLYRMLLRDGAPWPAAAAWTWLAALGTAVSWVARPNVFTLLFLLATVRVCDLYHQGRLSRRRTLWLVPLFAAWANTHGGFVAGLVTLGAAFGVEAALAAFTFEPAARRAARARAAHLALLTAGAFAATLINPYGWRLYPWVLQLLGDPYFMNLNHEWKPPPFRDAGSFRFELLMLLYPLLLAVSRRRPNAVELALGVLWLHFALNGFRYVPLWVLVATPTLARCSLDVPWLREAGRRLGLTEGEAGLFTPRTGPEPWVWSAVAAAALLLWARSAEGRFARHNPKFIPAAALHEVLRLHREAPETVVFHPSDWGGYLTWHGWPGFKNWIDDRNEAQGREHYEETFAVLRADPGWQQRLDGAGVGLVAVQPEEALAAALARAGWREVYRDEFAVIYRRNAPAAVPAGN